MPTIIKSSHLATWVGGGGGDTSLILSTLGHLTPLEIYQKWFQNMANISKYIQNISNKHILDGEGGGILYYSRHFTVFKIFPQMQMPSKHEILYSEIDFLHLSQYQTLKHPVFNINRKAKILKIFHTLSRTMWTSNFHFGSEKSRKIPPTKFSTIWNGAK